MPTPKWMSNVRIAHRGLHDDVSPENSLTAFSKAVEKGYAIEMDVHLSTDGVLMVFHDDTLDRMSNGSGLVREYDSDYLKSLRLKGSDEQMPTFDELLEVVGGKVPLLIEIKDHPNIGALEQVLVSRLDKYKGEFAVQSFNPFVVKWFADNKPNYTRGQLASYDYSGSKLPGWQKFLLKGCRLNFLTKPHFISYDIDTADQVISKIKHWSKQGKTILMWTVHNDKQLDIPKLVWDNIIFENYIPNI